MSKSKYSALFKAVGRTAADDPAGAEPLVKRVRKYSNPDYFHTTVYIEQNVMTDVKKALLDEPKDKQEFSGLVEVLLSNWLKTRGKINA